MQINNIMANLILTSYRTVFNDTAAGFFIYLFNSNDGVVPATADEALDLTPTTGNHTQLAKISISGGATGLTFAAPVLNVLSKTVAETWSGEVAFSGRVTTGTLAPTFARVVENDDASPGALNTTRARLQLTAGGPSSGDEVQIGTDTVTDNDANVQVINFMQITQPLS